MDRLPRTGEFYKDISDKTYQIVAVAMHAGTGEQMVVYQALFGDFGVYTQSVQQFAENFNVPKNMEALKEQQRTAGTFKEQSNTIGFLRNLQNPAGSYGSSQSAEEIKEKPQATSAVHRNGTDSDEHPDTAESVDRTQSSGYPGVQEQKPRPRTQSPAEARRIFRQNQGRADASDGGSYYDEKRRRQMEEREQRREMFRKSERHESATEELRANPCLLKFLEADTYEEKFHVLNTIQNDMTDRLIDDIAVVLDVVIPEGPLNDRFHQLRNIILTRQKYETNRFR